MKKNLLLSALLFSLVVSHCLGNLSVYVTVTSATCAYSNASGTSHPSGGIPPYTYLWSTSATSANISSIPAGTYTVTVTDSIGSTATASATVVSAQMNISGQWSEVSNLYPCLNECTGMWLWATNNFTSNLGGTPPYTFASSSGLVEYNYYPNPDWVVITGICANTNVTVYVTDSQGCTGQTTTYFNSPPTGYNPTITTVPACNSSTNGSVTISNYPNWETIWNSYPAGMGQYFCVTSDTLSSCFLSLPNNFNYPAPFTITDLAPGNYYVNIGYDYSNQRCPQYFPFTISDLGPNCSNVQGDVFLDLNGNCAEDIGDIAIPNTIVEFTPGPYYALTDASGHYFTNLVWGNYNMTHYPPATVTQLCPSNPFPISLSALNTSDTVNFADTSNIPFDVQMHISNGTARPGFNFNYGVRVSNLSYTSSGILTVTLDYDTLLSFVSANPVPFSTSPGQVVWQLNSITNFHSTSATVTLSVPPNPLLIGDTLFAIVNVQAATSEANLANNTVSSSHIIMGSFDPNLKTAESPATSFIPALDSIFNYTIQFQNTGNDTAFNIEVVDTLDSDLDVRTFVQGASSHPYIIDLTGQGIIHFYFNNILLPDSTTDEPLSHGFVSFQIKCKANRSHGTTIVNQSDIVFDFNPPVATNTTTNTVDLTMAINASTITICAGQSVTLSMIPELQNTPWKWRAGSCSASIIGSGNSITVSPTVSTTYFVRDSAGTIPTGSCFRKTITVIPLPTTNITPGGPTTFCQGNSVTLTTNATTSYLWSTGATTQSIIVSSGGSYSVTVTNGAGCSNSSSAVLVTVNPLPTASITPGGPTTFCQGNSVILTSSAANSYLWSDNTSTQSINVASSGNYFVTVTDVNNCSASTSLSVTVNPLPNASITPNGPTIFCQGDSVTLTSGAASSFLWSNSSATQSINVISSGNYIVTVTDANNCASASPAISVTVNPNPPVPAITQNGDSLISDAANAYQWYFNSVLIPGAISQSYHPPQNGNYSVVITDANLCTASSLDYPFIMTNTGNYGLYNSVLIYPNPVSDNLTIDFFAVSSERKYLSIYNVLGEEVLKREFSSQKYFIALSELSRGIYIAEVRSGAITYRQKIIKE